MNRFLTIAIVIIIIVATIFVIHNNSLLQNDQENITTITIESPLGSNEYTTIPAKPKRVIFFSSSSLDLWLGAEGKDFVIACPKFNFPPPSLSERLNDDITNLGQYKDIRLEDILQQNPDLVVFNKSINSPNTLQSQLKNAGIPILIIDNHNLQDTYYELNLYGQLLDKTDVASQEIERIKINIAGIEKKNKDKVKPKVALIWATNNSFSMLTPASRQSKFLNLAGGKNIIENSDLHKELMPLSLDYIAQNNPSFIFFITMGNKEKVQEQIHKTLSLDSDWQKIKAIRDKNFYILPPELFTFNHGLSVDRSIEYMSNLMHP